MRLIYILGDCTISAPKKLGIKTCYAKYGETKKVAKGKSGADFEINDVGELARLRL